MKYRELIECANEARKNAYVPYSHFAVGAAVLCADESIYSGCNIENAAYSPTCCAERVAIFKAVSEGKRKITAVCVVGGKEGQSADAPCYPCGVCRQVLSEFSAPDAVLVLADGRVQKLSELLPHAFKLER